MTQKVESEQIEKDLSCKEGSLRMLAQLTLVG